MIPASIRNNNPGAQYPGPSAKKFGGAKFETLRSKDGVHKIATFPTGVHGAAALFHLLHEGRDPLRRLRYRDKPLRQAIETWCGGYYAPTYCRVVTSHCDVGSDDVLTTDLLRDPQRAIPLAKAMALQEAGQSFPLDDTGWLHGHEMAFGAAEAPGWSPKNDVPTRNPEDKLDQAMGIAKIGTAVTAAGGSTAVGVASPDAVLTSLKSFQAFGTDLMAMANGPTMIIVGIGAAFYAASVYVLPKLGLKS